MKDEAEKPEKSASRGKRRRRRLLAAAVIFAAAAAALVVSVPCILVHAPLPKLSFDLSNHIDGILAEITRSKTVTAELEISRGWPDGFRIDAKGRILDWPYTAVANVRFGFIRADGDLALSIDGTTWRLFADFSAQSADEWRINANIAERPVSQDDILIADILSRVMPGTFSNLVFNGTFSLDAEAWSTEKRPVPAWSARASLKDTDARFETAPGEFVEAKNLRARFGADAIADHCDIAPMFPRADSISAAGFVLSNVYANVRATERSWLVTEAGADCCGGELRLYSMFLDPENLNAGATVFADGIDAGEILRKLSFFKGQASGRLHGKLPFFFKDGRSLHIKNTYLFSTPGETGKMRIDDPTPLLDNLATGGLPEEMRDNLAKALSDLDYKVLKFELSRGDGREASTLAVKLEGSATCGKTTVPVNLDLAFHGDFDELLNLGLKFGRQTDKETVK